MKSRNSISFFACFMAAIMLISALSGLSVAFGTEAAADYQVIQMDNVTVASQKTNTMYLDEQEEETVDPETIVTIIVKLEDEPVLKTYGTIERMKSGYQTLTTKGHDMQDALISKQNRVAANIENTLNLDVDFEYHYTLAFNGFAFKGPYGAIEKIKALDGVVTAEASTIYDLPKTVEGDAYGAKNYCAADMVYAYDAWNAGYDGEGMLAAVLDTGLNIEHEAFMKAPDTLKITKEALAEILATNNLQAESIYADLTVDDVYLRDKVPFAFDYANRDCTVSHGASDHGSHVAGITLADPQEEMLGMEGIYCRGVAPKAQLAVMKVFPDSGGGSSWSDVMAALEDCIYLGANVANMSLGSALGFPNIDKTYAEMYNCLDDNGVIPACAAGNDYSSAYSSSWGTDMATTENLDSSMVGSPSTYTESLSVAAIYNNKIFYSDYVEVAGVKTGYSDTAKSTGNRPDLLFKVALAGQRLPMVQVPGLGDEADYAGIDVTGKVALISRGDITFEQKVNNAANHGAIAAVIYDNVDSTNLVNMSITHPPIPAIFVYRSIGLLAIESINSGDGTIYVSDGKGMIQDAANGATPTDFSSWGPLANLTIKPEISAPGGNIMSTVDPAIGGDGTGYANYSGTSMATPNISGCITLVRQYVDDKFPNLSYLEKTILVNTLLMCTANPVVNDKGVEYGVRRQGAGMANVIDAISTQAYLSTDANIRPKLEIGDDPQRTGVYTLNFKITNFGDKTLSYEIAPSMTTADYEWIDQGDRATWVIKPWNMDVTGMMTYTTNYDNNIVSVNAGETKEITVTMTVNDEFRNMCAEVFKFGAYVEGYCYLKGQADAEGAIPPELSICYLGYYGGWSEVPVVDGGYYYDKPEDDLSCMSVPNTAASKLRSSVYLGLGMNAYLDADANLGASEVADADAMANFEFLADRCSISPANEDKYYDEVNYFTTGIMRNLRKFYYTVYDANTGEIYWEKNAGSVRKNADTSSAGAITPFGVSSNKMKAWAGGTTEEGTTVYIRCGGEAYYEKWDSSQATRSYWEIPVTLDNTAPVVVDSWSEGTKVFVKITDNHYAAFAGVFAMNDLENPIAKTFIAENERGAETTIEIDMSAHESVYLLLGDYACNEAQFVVTKSGATFAPIPDAPDTNLTYYAPVYALEDGETYLITTTGAFTGAEDTVYALTGISAQPYDVRLQGAVVDVNNQYILGGSRLKTMEWKYNAGSVQNVETGKYLGLKEQGGAYWLGMNDSSDIKWQFDGRSFFHNSSLTPATHLIYFATVQNSDIAAFDVFNPAESSSKIAVYKKVENTKSVDASITTTVAEADNKLTASINISKNPNAGSGMVTVTYDPQVIEFKKAQGGEATENVLVQPNDTVPGRLPIAFAGSMPLAPDGGELLKLTFEIKAAKGTVAIIDVVCNELISDDSTTMLTAEATGTTYVIGGGTSTPPTEPPTEAPTTVPPTNAPTEAPTTVPPTEAPGTQPPATEIPADAVKFTLSYVSEVDKVITLSLKISEKSEAASGVYTITYNPDLVELVKHKSGEVLTDANAMVMPNTSNPGQLIVAFASVMTLADEGGEMAIITFKVNDSVANGTQIDFGVEVPELLKEDSVTYLPAAGIGCTCYAGGEAPITEPPTEAPTTEPPTSAPTTEPPTSAPTTEPPTSAPTTEPPTSAPTTEPPTSAPTTVPPTEAPTTVPPTEKPTDTPTDKPTDAPTDTPTEKPTEQPTQTPGTPGTGAQFAPYAAIVLAVLGIVGMGYFFARREEM